MSIGQSFPATPPHRRRRRRWVVVITLAFAVVLGLALRPRVDSQSFVEGYYEQPAILSYSSGGGYPRPPGIYFQHGRFERGDEDRRKRKLMSDPGSYDASPSKARITYDAAGCPDLVLHYRNIGGVAVLLTDAGLAAYEKEHLLKNQFDPENGYALFYVRMEPGRNYEWNRLVRNYPEFAAALPASLRTLYTVPVGAYYRFRWRDFREGHPALDQRLPAWLRNL